VLARLSNEELDHLFTGYGHKPYFVEGEDPDTMHQLMAGALDTVMAEIQAIQSAARSQDPVERPRWPMIILRTPKGWTGPKVVDGLPAEGSFRSHQVPLTNVASNPEHLRMLEEWMKSYRPAELFDADGKLVPELAELAPKGHRRMGANPHANGGQLLRDLLMPDFSAYAVDVPKPGTVVAEATRVMGDLLRDVMKLNGDARNFRVFGPDETGSNRLGALFEVTDRTWMARILPSDDQIGHDGRVMEVLSEHMCQGWLEGYLLTGRHGLFSCYEAFIHIIDSMFNQHAKWLKVTRGIPWRRPIASLNYLLTSHVWRQDHNGFSHQDPGFIDQVVNKKADIVRVYLPPDANTLLSVTDHCLRSRNYVNVIVAGKQPGLQWLDMEAAVRHCHRGNRHLGLGEQRSGKRTGRGDGLRGRCSDSRNARRGRSASPASSGPEDSRRQRGRPDDAPTFERAPARSAGSGVRFHLYSRQTHRLRLSWLSLAHPSPHLPPDEPRQLARAGIQGRGTTTTPFDMTVLNDLDRFHLAGDTIDRVPRLRNTAGHFKQFLRDKLAQHKRYIVQHGDDMPEIRDWKWTY